MTSGRSKVGVVMLINAILQVDIFHYLERLQAAYVTS